MDDNAPQGNPPADFNKLDLSQLQGFSFGTQWTQDKQSPAGERDRPRRDDRRDGPMGGDRRDRRAFRKPMGDAPAGDAPQQAPAGAPERREFSGDRRPQRDGGNFRGGGGGGDFRGGPRRDGPGGFRGEPMDRGPYDSPYFAATFYPEDTSFNALVKTIRTSCRTIELFEIARTVVAKSDRFVVVVGRKPEPGQENVAAPAKGLLYISVPDGVPFESEEAAVSHVMSKHLSVFFDTAEVETDAPKGNFQVVNKCGVTGELLGPPNYHRYNQLVQQHFAAKALRMPFEAFRARIETVREPEAIQQWLEKMKKVTRYTWKTAAPKAAPVAPVAEATPAAEGAASAEAPAPAPEAPPALTFDALEDAKMYLLTNAREKVLRTSDHARFHGKALETLPQGEIRRAVEGALQRQQRFPLDTANALRGRLRREHFTIFKKGSKGVSYVCAVKRKFRVPGQTFSDSIGALIAFIEANAMVKAGELPAKFLAISAPAPAAEPGAEGTPAPTLTIEQRDKIGRMQGDLVWLVREGYVTEFIDGSLYAPPPMVEARKKEVESEEHDPENFPEAPKVPPAPVASAETPAASPQAAAEVAAEAVAEAASVESSPAPVTEAAPAAVESPVEAPKPEEQPPATA